MPCLETKIERLQNLIRVMEEVKAKGLESRLDMKDWAQEKWGADEGCGTTYCAAGFCAIDSWFNAQGFRLIRGHAGSGRFIITVDGYFSWDALEYFFSMDYAEAAAIFSWPATIEGVIEQAQLALNSLKPKASHV